MKSYKPLQDAFHKLDQSTVSWHKNSRFPKTMESANAVLYRNAVVDASTVAYLSHCLGLSNKQTIAVLDAFAVENPKKRNEVDVLKQLIAPVELTEQEQNLVGKYRSLAPAKRKIVDDMVNAL